MKKRLLFLFAGILLSLIAATSFAAASLEITKQDKGSVVVSELNNPAVFDFLINNDGPTDSYEIYTLIGVSMSPRGTFSLPGGKTTTVEVMAYPDTDQRRIPGFFTFEYQLKGQNSGIFTDKMTVQIVNLKDTLAISADDVSIGDENVYLDIKNMQNTNIDNLRINFKSGFFDSTKIISLAPYGETNVSVKIDSSELKKLSAGSYVINSIADPDRAKVDLGGTIKYLEKQGTTLTKVSSGFVIKKTTFTRTNEGNVPNVAKIEISKNIISRLFTTYSVEPMNVQRAGLSVTYTWEKSLAPSESFSVTAATNYTLPFIFLALIIFVAVMVRIYTQTSIVLTKRVSFVKTSRDEFALKVKVHVRARKNASRIQIIDRLPGVVKLYEKFGVMPDRVDEATKRIFWNIDHLNAGEERVFSYIIYSKIKVVGRFELPSATAIYEQNDKTYEVFSNKTFFVADTNVRKY